MITLILHVYSRVLLDVGDFSEGIKYLKRALEINEGRQKPWRGKLTFEYANLALAYASLGNIDEAEDAFDKADEALSQFREKAKGNRAERFAIFHDQMGLIINGVLQSSLGDLREAETYFLRAIDELEVWTQGRKGSTWMRRADVMGEYLVENLLAQGRVAEVG